MSSGFTASDLVLITGANGHVGQHVFDQLLRLNPRPRVRGTVRSQDKVDEIIDYYKTQKDINTDALELVVVKDISSESAFDEAIKGVTHLAHIASPIVTSLDNVEENVFKPAVNGTLAALRAAAKTPSVKRVVVTSSFAAIADVSKGWRPDYTYSEKDFNPLTREQGLDPSYPSSPEMKNATEIHKPFIGYVTSKILAERAAWNIAPKSPLPAPFRDDSTTKASFNLSVINPTYIYGPHVLPLAKGADSFSFSNKLLWQTATGETGKPEGAHIDVDWPVVCDVRDVARAHILALTKDEAKGERFIVNSGYFTYSQLAEIIKSKYPSLTPSNGPSQEFPHFKVDGTKALKVLGLDSYIPLEKSVTDTIDQVLKA